jgi:hypothetical protein
MRKIVLASAVLVLGGCASYGGPRVPDHGVVIVSGRSERVREPRRARSVRVPPGHYPPPGECRLWYPGVSPGHQPRPVRCSQLMRRERIARGAFLLYGGRAWDTDYDWRGYDRRHPGSVPRVVLRIVATVR